MKTWHTFEVSSSRTGPIDGIGSRVKVLESGISKDWGIILSKCSRSITVGWNDRIGIYNRETNTFTFEGNENV